MQGAGTNGMVAALMASLALALTTPAASAVETVLAEPPPVFNM